MHAAQQQFAQRNCSILVVTQAQPQQLAHYVRRMGWQVPLVCDPERAVYRLFGLERTSWLTFLHPRVVWGYFRGMLRGYRLKMPYWGEDVRQLGGDFLLDRHRRLLFAYRSAVPTDRPAAATLLEALSALATPSPPPATAVGPDDRSAEPISLTQ